MAHNLLDTDDGPVARTGVRGRIDRLIHEYTTKAQALLIASKILDEDDLRLAQASAPKKFLQAVNHRHEAAGRLPLKAERMSAEERADQIRQFLLTKPEGATVTDVAEAFGLDKNTVFRYINKVAKPGRQKRGRESLWTARGPKGGAAPQSKRLAYKNTQKPIHGKTLSLFMLEHLDDHGPRPVAYLMDALAKAGSPVNTARDLNGVNASLTSNGFARKTDGGLQRTAKGREYAQALREKLEAAGKVVPGGYLAAA